MFYFISDLHLGNGGILHWAHRPFKDVQEMNAGLIERWNSVVKDTDTVIHLGDFGSFKYAKKLKGNIIYIVGNHDHKIWKKFPLASNRLYMNIEGHRCVIQHYPFYYKGINDIVDPFHDHDSSLDEAMDNRVYDFVISGHIHNNYYEEPREDGRGFRKVGRCWSGVSLNLSCEMINYTPISIDVVKNLLNERRKEIGNTHPNKLKKTNKFFVPKDCYTYLEDRKNV